ncbi:MAG TPA: heparan-alpha-glucosaminide N-acetyltransferase domain-containing protein [Blastocatellia bacterium]|nr:heparan-alpha-glucosaminide N-acetyltransferase domain-containing protein [Blastocatellia bacterium]
MNLITAGTKSELDAESSSGKATGTAPPWRVDSVDLLRGVVMIFMLLDHTREFVHRDVLNFEATDLTRTNVLLFFTRWITHFCAPVFVFLAGTGAFLQTTRGKSRAELSKFLVKRGLWFILLEFTLIRVVVWFNIDFHFALMLQVIWVIGVSMVALAALIHLPLRWIVVGSIAMIALHNLLDIVRVNPMEGLGFWGSVWMILHQPGVIFFTPTVYALALYPLIPWIGVLTAGYAFGAYYQLEEGRRRRILFRLGAALLASFVLLRCVNVYGDPIRWAQQKNAIFTILSFLNVSKYPPSLSFLLLTLGAAILALPWFERIEKGMVSRILITFGRVPLFFYFGQWIAVHCLAMLAGYLAGQPIAWLFIGPLDRPSPNPGNLGFSLWVVYIFWFLGLLLLYPPCRWFADVKRRRKDWWLSYL